MYVIALAACVGPGPTANGEAHHTGVLSTGSVEGARAAAPLLNPRWALTGPNRSYFGFAASAGDVDDDGFSDVFVGSPIASSYEGRVELFSGSASGPVSPAGWSRTGTGGEVLLGVSTASCDLDADGFADLIAGESDSGRVNVWYGSGSGPTGELVIDEPEVLGATSTGTVGTDTGGEWNGNGWSSFGWAVACGDLDGDGFGEVVVGAPYGGGQDRGRVYVFPGSASGVTPAPTLTVEGVPDAEWGTSVAVLGDVNGDGYGDLAVGTGEWTLGPAAVFHGGASGPDATADWTIDLAPAAFATGTTTGGTWWDTGRDSGDEEPWAPRVGENVAHAGDIDGDGFDDLLIGVPYDADESGVALLYLGSATGFGPTAAWRVELQQEEAGFGMNLGGLSDLNGDGYREIAVTAPLSSVGAYAEGAAYVFLGAADGADTSAAFTLSGGGYYALLWDVTDLGDVDADGFTDIGFTFIGDESMRIFSGAVELEPPGETGETGDTGDTDPPEPPDTDPPTSTDGQPHDHDDEGEDKGGCGCASGGAGVGWLALPLALVVRRRTFTRA